MELHLECLGNSKCIKNTKTHQVIAVITKVLYKLCNNTCLVASIKTASFLLHLLQSTVFWCLAAESLTKECALPK